MRSISWEKNQRGGFEAWYCPPGAIERSDKTYLVYIGKRKLAQIGTGPDRAEQIRQIVLNKQREKGIAST